MQRSRGVGLVLIPTTQLSYDTDKHLKKNKNKKPTTKQNRHAHMMTVLGLVSSSQQLFYWLISMVLISNAIQFERMFTRIILCIVTSIKVFVEQHCF